MLSSKARYGLKAMESLALRYGENNHVPVELIAEEKRVPLKFLEAILTQLRKQNFLASRRGPSGGYRLTRPPEEISLAQIIRSLDGPFAPSPCSRSKDPQGCEGCGDPAGCSIQPFLREVRDAMAEVLENRSLFDLMEMGRKLRQNDAPMWYI